MRERKHSLPMRLLAVLLSTVFVFSMIPSLGLSAQAATEAMGVIHAVADAPTLDSWKGLFDLNNISTEHAGGIWTDKSVLTADNLSALGNVSGLSVGENNFMVALSALAANSVIVGQGSKPTDTVFVLDVSGSMSSTELRSMVSAANIAIDTLLSGASNTNRVGVVLYSTEASTLLPLDHYTPVIDGGTTEYIELSGSTIRSARVETSTGGSSGNFWDDWFGNNDDETETTYLKDGNGNDVDRSVRTTGGTYIQGGLWAAKSLFDNVEVSDARTPVLVLMSDGAPTFTTNSFNNVPGESNYGSGNSTTDADGFVTQLTAAYVKEQMKVKYNSTAYMYTLGLGVDSVTDSDKAKEVLDPSGNTHAGIEALWNSYEALATANSKSMTVSLGSSGNRAPSLTYDSTVAGKRAYVDRYFSASQASDLAAAFQNVVNEISLQAGYYVTHLDGENANLGGYITFVDEIGSGMQVKEIEGVLIGETLYSGKVFAAALESGAFGLTGSATSLGDNLVWAVKERLGITDAEMAKDLLESAYAAGQLSGTLDGNNNVTAFSNYVGWFGDANGNYVGFWNDKDPNAVVPAGAAYANKCYLMLGSTTGEQTNHASDMMYVAIQVSKTVTDGKVLEKTPEQVSFRIPASLLPMVTYQIKLNADSVENATQATVMAKAASPIRLLFEVGVHEKMNPVNVHEFLRANYTAKDADGNYYLYSNAWRWDTMDSDWPNHPVRGDEVLNDTAKNSITYAYFEPGEGNEHYYFTENQQIYTKNGNEYTPLASAPTDENGEYFYKHYTFTSEGTGIDFHYGELSAKAVQTAIAAGTNYVPAGTLHYHDATHTHDVNKGENKTNTYFAVRHQLVDAKINASSQSEHNYELVYMGNNGRLTYAPAQGISIEKQMANGTTPDVPFTFDVVLTGVTGNTSYDTLRIAVDGKQSAGTVDATDGRLSVQVKPGERLYILGMPAVGYSVTERRADGYLESERINATGTVAVDTVKNVTFVNRVRGAGTLTVYKTVKYNNGAAKTAEADNNKFPVTVTLKDDEAFFNGTVSVDGTATEVVNGLLTFNIVDGQTVVITGIPEGCTYEVAEGTTMPNSGYTYVTGIGLEGKIKVAEISAAVLENAYTPEPVTIDPVTPAVTVEIEKILDTIQTPNFTFNFKLQRYNGTAWDDVYVNDELVTTSVTVTAGAPEVFTADLPLAGLSFESVGSYAFRVVEIIPDEPVPGMTYDRTHHDFVVTVTDKTLDGKLEIDSVTAVDTHTAVNGNEVTAGFTNEYALNSTKLTMEFDKILTDKALSDDTHTILPLQDGQFHFTLTEYTDDTYTAVKGTPKTVANGILGDIIFPAITYTELGTYYYTVTEDIPISVPAGYTYDTAKFYIAVTVGTSGTDLAVTNVLVKKGNDEVDASVANNLLTGEALYFNNIYKAAPAEPLTLSGTKEFVNMTPGLRGNAIAIDDGMFEFTLTGPNITGGSETVKNVGATFTFSRLIFTEAGEYTYTITEVGGGQTVEGITYDAAAYTVTVTVVDDGSGKLKVDSISYTKAGTPTGSVLFHNTYKAGPAEPLILSGTKVLTGIRNIIDGEFAFVLKNSAGTVVETVKNVGNNFSFAPLNFSAAGTYTYTVTEEKAGQEIDGVKYDATVYTVTVNVTDNDYDGKLETEVIYNNGTSNVANLAFENTYTVKSVTVALTGRKNLAGRPTQYPLQANEFAFNLTGDGINWTEKNDAEGNIKFNDLTYTEPGVHTFTLKEVIPTQKAPGIIYDEKVYTVTITVTDNGKGQLVAAVSIPGQDVEDVHFRFFNRYHAEDTDPVILGGTKELTGRPLALQNNEFSFVLKNEAGEEIETVKNNGASFTFSGIAFDAAGEYKYTISELNGGQTIGGIRYDSKVYDVTVTVTDNGTGKLSAEVAYKLNGQTAAPKFTNTYDAADTAPVILSGEKNLVGRPSAYPMRDGEFEFTLTGPNIPGGSETVENVGTTFTFSQLIFTEAGEYNYTVTEVKGGENHNGIAYDAKTYRIKINVTDNNQGQLIAEIEYTDGAVKFTNIYDAADTDAVVLEAQKALNGRPVALRDNEFSFNLKGNNVDETVQNVSGKATFTGLTFDTVGVYTYEITEVPGNLTYITYDDTVYTVTIEVTDDGTGKLKTNVIYAAGGSTVDADDVIFTNVYKADKTDEIELGGDKTLTDITGGKNEELTFDDGDFSFNLKGEGVDETVKNVGKKFAFSKLSFTAAGVYTYTITEVGGGRTVDGITYDAAVYTVTVTVEDDSTGKLKVTSTTYTKGTDTVEAVVFNNTYKAEKTDNVVLGGTKELTGRPLALQDDEFSFVLKNEAGEEIETVKNNGASFTFSGIAFDAAGEYKYTISELNGGQTIGGIRYDSKIYDVTVTVTDNGTGKLGAEVAYKLNGQTAAPKFTNTYDAADTAPVILSGEKNLVGRPSAYPMRDGEFEFTLTGPNIPGGSETVENVGTTFTFSQLIFTEAGEYNYTVTEVKGGENHNGIAYDAKTYRIKITVTDNNQGQLIAEIVYTDGSVKFTNTYDAADTDAVVLGAEKVLNGRPEALKDNEFSFNLKGEGVNETVKNVSGKATFTGLVFDTVGVYTYEITEVAGDLTYITYDDTVYTVTIEVTDDGTGKLKTNVIYTAGGATVAADDVVFTNTYKADGTDEIELGGDKNLTNITGGKNEAMTFNDGDFSFNLKGEGVDETVENVGKKFTFSKLSFTAAGVYTYTITEVGGGRTVDGITYDAAVYTVTVTVEDDSTGKLKVTSTPYTKVTDTVEAVVFNNTYEVTKGADAVVEATKELIDITDGGNKALTPGDGKFSFNLKGKGVDETVKNVGASVKFSALVFDEPGTYTYQLTEIKGNMEGVTYDETVYTVTITVADGGKGELIATVKYDKTPVFRNIYEAPKVEQENPKTGVQTDLTVVSAMMMLSAVTLMAVLVIGKKKFFAE